MFEVNSLLTLYKQSYKKNIFFVTLLSSLFQCINSTEVGSPKQPKTPITNLQREHKEFDSLNSEFNEQLQCAKQLNQLGKKIHKYTSLNKAWFNNPENTVIKKSKYVFLSGITCIAIGLGAFFLHSSEKRPIRFSPLQPTPLISRPLVKYGLLGIGWLGSILLTRWISADPSRKIIEKITLQYKNYVEPLFKETSELEAQLEIHEKAMLELHAKIGSTKNRVRTLDSSLEEVQKRSTSLEQQVRVLQSPSPKLLELEQQVNNHDNILSSSLYRPGCRKKCKNIKTSSSMDDILFQRHELNILRAQREKSNGTPTILEEIPVRATEHRQEEERKHESERISISRAKIMKLHSCIQANQEEYQALQKKIQELIHHEENQFSDELSSAQRPISPRTAAYKLIFNSLQKSATTLDAMRQDIVKLEEPELL